MTSFTQKLDSALKEEKISFKIYKIFARLYETYTLSVRSSSDNDTFDTDAIFTTLLEKAEKEIVSPHQFLPYHQKITTPFDYYTFGIEFLRPLVDFSKSKNLYPQNVNKIVAQLAQGDNVVLFANHQTELDPQLISLMFDSTHPGFASEMIFVAGDRVLTDPMAIPFSLGRNLLCIYSKKYIDTPPERREEKQLHNKRVMKLMSELFQEGGKCIFVAPSGGRDRPNSQGVVDVAQFDPHSIEMFRLMSSRAQRMTHFYPLALATYDILPPPNEIQTELGEQREIYRRGAGFAFCNELDLDNYPGCDEKDKHTKRLSLAKHIHDQVKEGYNLLKEKLP